MIGRRDGGDRERWMEKTIIRLISTMQNRHQVKKEQVSLKLLKVTHLVCYNNKNPTYQSVLHKRRKREVP